MTPQQLPLDAVSLTLITQLVQDGSVIVVLTVRTGEPMPDALDVLWRGEHLRRLDLEPLTPEAVDTLLHLVIAEVAGIPSLVALAAENRAQVNAWLDTFPLLPRNIEHANAQHENIVTAILAGRADAAPARGVAHGVLQLRLGATQEALAVLEALAVRIKPPIDDEHGQPPPLSPPASPACTTRPAGAPAVRCSRARSCVRRTRCASSRSRCPSSSRS